MQKKEKPSIFSVILSTYLKANAITIFSNVQIEEMAGLVEKAGKEDVAVLDGYIEKLGLLPLGPLINVLKVFGSKKAWQRDPQVFRKGFPRSKAFINFAIDLLELQKNNLLSFTNDDNKWLLKLLKIVMKEVAEEEVKNPGEMQKEFLTAFNLVRQVSFYCVDNFPESSDHFRLVKSIFVAAYIELDKVFVCYCGECQDLAEYKRFVASALKIEPNSIAVTGWQKSLAKKITSFDEYKGVVEAIENLPGGKHNQELAKKFLNNTANVVAEKLLSGADKRNFLKFMQQCEDRYKEVFLSTEHSAVKTAFFNEKPSRKDVGISSIDKLLSEFLTQFEERRSIFTKEFSAKDLAIYYGVIDVGSAQNDERRCKDLLSFLYLTKAKDRFNDDSLEQHLIVDVLTTFMIVQKPSLEQFQSLIYFLYDLKLTKDSGFGFYDEKLLRDLLVMKAQSLETVDEFLQFFEFLSGLKQKYRIPDSLGRGVQEKPEFSLEKEIRQLTEVVIKEGSVLSKKERGQPVKELVEKVLPRQNLSDLKPQALSRRFFKTKAYNETEWANYQSFVESLLANAKRGRAGEPIDQKFMACWLLAIGIEQLSAAKRDMFGDSDAVSKKTGMLITFLRELNQSYGVPGDEKFKKLGQEILIRQVQPFDEVSSARDVVYLVKKLSDIEVYLGDKYKSEEFRTRLFDAGIKKLVFLKPGLLKEDISEMYCSLFVDRTQIDREMLGISQDFCEKFFIQVVQTCRKDLDTRNPAHCMEFIDGLLFVYFFVFMPTASLKIRTSLKKELNPLIKGTFSAWANNLTDVADYAKYIEYVNQAGLPEVAPETLSKPLKTRADYKVILQALLNIKELTPFVANHIEFLSTTAPVTVLAVIDELKREGKLSGKLLKLANEILEVKKNKCPLLRSLINLQGEEEFFKEITKEDQALAKLDQVIVQLIGKTTCVTTAGGHTQCKLDDVTSLKDAYSSLALVVNNNTNQKFSHNVYMLFQALPKCSQLEHHHFITLFPHELKYPNFTPKESRQFLAELLKLKESYQLSDDQMDNQLFMQILTVGAEKAANMTDGFYIYSSRTVEGSKQLTARIRTRSAQEFMDFLSSLLDKPFFSDSEKTQIRVLQGNILIEQVRLILNLYVSTPFMMVIALRNLYDVCKTNNPERIGELLEIGYQFIGKVNNSPMGMLSFADVKSEFVQSFIPYVIDKRLAENKTKGDPELFEYLIKDLDSCTRDNANFIHPYFNQALKDYYDSCVRLKAESRFDAYKRFARFVLCELSSWNQGEASILLNKGVENLTWGEYQQLVDHLLEGLVKVNVLSKWEWFENFIVATLPIVAKQLENSKETKAFVQFVADVKDKFKLSDEEIQTLTTLSEDVLTKQLTKDKAKLAASWEKVEAAFKIPQCVRENLSCMEGCSEYVAWSEKVEKIEAQLDHVPQNYPQIIQKIADIVAALEIASFGAKLTRDLNFLAWENSLNISYAKRISEECYHLLLAEDFIGEQLQIFEKMLQNTSKLVRTLDEELDREIKDLEAANRARYATALKRYEGLSFQVDRDELDAKKEEKLALALLNEMSRRDEQGSHAAKVGVEQAFADLDTAVAEKKKYLAEQIEWLGGIVYDIDLLLASDKPLLKTQMDKLKEFEDALTAVENDLKTPIPELQKAEDALQAVDDWADKVRTHAETCQAHFNGIVEDYERVSLTVEMKTGDLLTLRDEIGKQTEKFNFAWLEEMNDASSAVFKERRGEVEKAFRALDESFEKMEQIKQASRKGFEHSKENYLTNLPTWSDEQADAELKEFREVVQRLKVKLLEQSVMIESLLKKAEATLVEQEKRVEEAFDEQIKEKTTWQGELIEQIAAKKQGKVELIATIKNNLDHWLVENSVSANVGIEDLGERQRTVGLIINEAAERQTAAREKSLADLEEMKRQAKRMLRGIVVYRKGVEKVLSDKRGARLVLGLFSWLPFAFVAPLKKFVAEQEALASHVEQLKGIEEQIKSLSELSDDPFVMEQEALAERSTVLLESAAYLGHGLMRELSKESLEKERNRWPLEIKGVLAGVNMLLQYTNNFSLQCEQYHEAGEVLERATREQATLDELANAIQTVKGDREGMKKQLLKMQRELEVLHTEQRLFTDQITVQRHKQNITKKFADYQTKVKQAGTSLADWLNKEKWLHRAATRGDTVLVDLLVVELKVDTNVLDSKGQTPLHIAVKRGNTALVRQLVELKANVNVKDKEGHTPLWLAFAGGHKEIVDCLREKGADGQVVDLSALLLQKVKDNNETAVRLLLEERDRTDKKGWIKLGIGAVDKTSAYPFTPLRQAVKTGSLELIKLLIKHREGSSQDLPDRDGNRVAHSAVIRNDMAIMKYLLDAGMEAVLNNQNGLGETALHLALRSRYVDIAKLLLTKNLDVNLVNNANETLLHLAVKDECIDVVEALLAKRANVDLKDGKGDTALHIAVRKNNGKLVGLLLERGAKLKIRNQKGEWSFDLSIRRSFLNGAVKSGNLALIKCLIEKGGAPIEAVGTEHSLFSVYVSALKPGVKRDIVAYLAGKGAEFNENEKDEAGNNLLHLAAKQGDVQMVERCAVFTQKAIGWDKTNTNTRNKAGDTALHLAAAGGYVDVVKALLVKGADVNLKDGKGDTALHLAMENCREVIPLLLEKGADVNTKSGKGDTMLHLAVQQNNLNLVKWLYMKGAKLNVANQAGEMPFNTVGGRNMFALLAREITKKAGPVTGALTRPETEQLVMQGGGNDLLYLAAKEGNLELFKWLVQEKKVDVNQYDGEGCTLLCLLSNPLMFPNLSDKCPKEELELLLGVQKPLEGVEKEVQEKDLTTKNKRQVLIEYVIEKGATFPSYRALTEVQDKEGKNNFLHLLVLTAQNLNEELLKNLVEQKMWWWVLERPNVLNARNDKGNTVLHLAIQNGSIDLVAMLVEKGAKLDVRNEKGERPFDTTAGQNLLSNLQQKKIDEKYLPFMSQVNQWVEGTSPTWLLDEVQETNAEEKAAALEYAQGPFKDKDQKSKTPPPLEVVVVSGKSGFGQLEVDERKLFAPQPKENLVPQIPTTTDSTPPSEVGYNPFGNVVSPQTSTNPFGDSTDSPPPRTSVLSSDSSQESSSKSSPRSPSPITKIWPPVLTQTSSNKAGSRTPSPTLRVELDPFDAALQEGQYEAAKQLLKEIPGYVNNPSFTDLPLLTQRYLKGEALNPPSRPDFYQVPPLAKEYVELNHDLLEAVKKGDSDAVAHWFQVRKKRLVFLEKPPVSDMKKEEKNLLECQVFAAVNKSITLLKLLLVQREQTRRADESGWDEKMAEEQQAKRREDGKIVRILTEKIPKEGVPPEMVLYDLADSPPAEVIKAVAVEPEFGEVMELLVLEESKPESALEREQPESVSMKLPGWLGDVLKIGKELRNFAAQELGKAKEKIVETKQQAVERVEATVSPAKDLIEVYGRRDKRELDGDVDLVQTWKYDLYVMVSEKPPIRKDLDEQYCREENKDNPKIPMLIRCGNELWFYGRTPGGMTLLEPLDRSKHVELYDHILPEKGYDLVVVPSSDRSKLFPGERLVDNDFKEKELAVNEFRVRWDADLNGFWYRVKGTDIEGKKRENADFISAKEGGALWGYLGGKRFGSRYNEFLGVVNLAAKAASKGNLTESTLLLKPYLSDLLKVTENNGHTGAIKKLKKSKVPNELYEKIGAIKGHSHGVMSADKVLGKGRKLAEQMSDWITKEIGSHFKAEDIINTRDVDGNTLLHLAVRDNLDVIVQFLLPSSLQEDLKKFAEAKFADVTGKALTAGAGAAGDAVGTVAGVALGTLVTAATIPVLGPFAPLAGVLAGKLTSLFAGGVSEAVVGATYGAARAKILCSLETTIDLCHKNNTGDTPLHIAAATSVEQNLWIVAALLAKAKSGDLNLQNNVGNTPLHVAVRHKNAHIASMLLLAGVNLNIQDAEGKTPLHLAAIKGDELLFVMLLERGAGMHVQTKLGYRVADLIVKKIALLEEQIKGAKMEERLSLEDEKARYERMQKVLGLKEKSLLGDAKKWWSGVEKAEKEKELWWNTKQKEVGNRTAIPPASDSKGNTILHVLVQNKENYQLVKYLLLNYAVDLNGKNKAGDTPLHLAMGAGNDEQRSNVKMIKLLIEHGANMATQNQQGQTPIKRVPGKFLASIKEKLKLSRSQEKIKTEWQPKSPVFPHPVEESKGKEREEYPSRPESGKKPTDNYNPFV